MESSKAERMQHMLLKKKECEKIAMEVVLRLIEPNVDKDFLIQRAGQIHLSHWDDIVEERKISGICGWVLCDEHLDVPLKQKYIIRNNRVFDITDRKNYCSSTCYGSSEHFKRQIPESPLWLRDEEPEPVFTLIEGQQKAELSLTGIAVKLTGIELPSSSDSESDQDEFSDKRDTEI